jgi:hypothetical protein
MTEVTTTPEEPVLRVTRSVYGRAGAETITIEDIDSDFRSYPSFVELVVDELLGSGHYNDSDHPDTICLYSTDHPDAVRAQWEALKAAHPGLWDESDEEGGEEATTAEPELLLDVLDRTFPKATGPALDPERSDS